MAGNSPPIASIFSSGTVVSSGYPIFVSKDTSGTMVVPTGNYLWTGTLWIAALGDTNGNTQVSLTGSNAIYNGTYTPTGTAASIASSQACSAVVVQNDPLNSNGYIYVGNSAGQTIALAPGASHVYEVTNVDIIWAKTGNGTQWQLNWEAKS